MRIKAPKNCRNRSKGVHLRGDSLPNGPVSEMTYTVSSGTLNHTIPYHTILYQKWKFLPFWGQVPTPGHRLAWNFARPSGLRCPVAVPNFTWIGATNRPSGAKMLIFSLWVNLIPTACLFMAILPARRATHWSAHPWQRQNINNMVIHGGMDGSLTNIFSA